MELRMRLVPYIHAAFVTLSSRRTAAFPRAGDGPPGRSRTWGVDDQYMVGDVPARRACIRRRATRSVYLPEGDWFDYLDRKRLHRQAAIHIKAPLEQIPIFVKSGTLLPLAELPCTPTTPPVGAYT